MATDVPDAKPIAKQGDYEIRFEPCRKRVRVEYGGMLIADSTRAIIVRETRAPPVHYLPRDDVRMDLLERTPLRTHCPFRGDASYWTLRVGDHVAENAAWSYEEPYPDAEPIRGHLAFYREKIAALYEGDQEAAFLDTEGRGAHANPIAGWLIGEAWKAPASEDLMGRFCRFLREAGYPLARSTVIIPTLHPQVFATVLVWREDVPGVRVVYEPHDILLQPRFADSPFAPIIRGAGGVRRHLEDPDVKLDFPVVRDLHAEGATDYAAMPFRFSDGQINVISMTSFTRGGFTAAFLGSVHEIMPALGRLFEVHAQRRISVGLLETYLGRNTGRRVLDGQIKHGDGQVIHAVIWFCDLRDSTHITASMETAAYLAHLNRFFMAMAGAIIDSGGEILSYIGDAVLAIFPIADPARTSDTGVRAPEACAQAIRAARAAAARIAATNGEHAELPPIRYGIGLHIGDVTYGNIGIPQRLQFTVIGSAANEASRIEGMTKELGEPVLVSAEFAAHRPDDLVSKGAHALKGVSVPKELFALR
jgi:adenylate cyclase